MSNQIISKKLAGLDTLRAFAIIIVVLFHYPLGSRRKKHKIGKVQYMYVCIIILLIVMIVGAFYFILG
nr:hypothetical protein [Gammaproteobacteria bacterium]